MQQKHPATVGEYFRSLRILHLSLMGGVLILTLILLLLNNYRVQAVVNEFVYMGIGLVFFALLGTYFFLSTWLNNAKNAASLKEKMDAYRQTFVMKMAFTEGAALANLIFYFLINSLFNLLMVLLMLLLMSMQRPSRERMAAELELSPQEESKIKNDDTPLQA